MDVSFSDRLSYIIALTEAISLSGPGSANAGDEARALESIFFEQSKSKSDYDAYCEGKVAALRLTASPPMLAETSPRDEIFNLEGPDIGNYAHSTFHRDGQMSTVFKAETKDASAAYHVVALKVTHPSSMEAPHNSEREARVLTAARHEHIVPLIESFWQTGGRFVLAFPFMRQDLENLLRSDVLSKAQTSMVVKGLFQALSHLHSVGIIHRDVKPSNILLKSMDGPVYLADFGIAWSPTDRESEPAMSKITDVGTTSYRPPELLFGDRAYDTSLDIWAAGCVVAEMVRRDHQPLFDAGPLGSELGLIKSMFSTLGTPDDDVWPSAKSYPDWGKMRFQAFPSQSWNKILAGGSPSAVDFVKRTVCYETTQRLTANEALQHPFVLH